MKCEAKFIGVYKPLELTIRRSFPLRMAKAPKYASGCAGVLVFVSTKNPLTAKSKNELS